MKITDAYIRAALDAQGLYVPEAEIENIRLRLETWMAAYEEIEREIGAEMNVTDPIPPIQYLMSTA